MELKPTEPPGRITRKLRAYVSEIARLRVEGYTIEAIRKALQDAGVVVGWSTVQREASRAESLQAGQLVRSAPAAEKVLSETTKNPNAKPTAEAFFSGHTNNRLLNRKKQS